MTDHFVSVAQMIDDLRSDDKELRTVAMRALVTIAQTLGPERTREELIPYVTDYLDEDDGVLRVMASKFGMLLQEVGGLAFIDHLLQPLETLCTLDEVTVRDEAIAAVASLAKTAFTPSSGSVDAQNKIVAMAKRLSESDFAPSRCSACGLVAAPLGMAPAATKRELKNIFAKLCDDAEVMVRRAACVALGSSVTEALGENVSEFLGQLSKFFKDANDSVRLQTVNAAIAMCPVLNDAGVTQVIGLVKALGNDTAWRVRFMLADRVGALCHAWPQRDASKVGLALFRTLCNDPAPEIKAAAVFNLDLVAQRLDSDEAKKDALDVAVRLVDDSTAHVRNCLAAVLLKALQHLPKPTWQSTVIPTCTKLLGDSDPQVRLGLVGSFAAANVGKDDSLNSVATAMTPVIIALAKDTNWRVRETVVQQLPAVVQGGADLTAQLIDVCVEALTDRVATIRAAAASACRQLAARQGGEWVAGTLLPRVSSLGQSKNYMQRVTMLYVIRQLLEACDEATCRSELIPVAVKLAADPVANVRLNAAHAIRWATINRKVAASEVDAAVTKLKSDKDVDVRDAIAPPMR